MSNLVKVFLIFFLFYVVFCDQELTITIDPGTEQCFYEQLSAGSAFELDYQVRALLNVLADNSFWIISVEGH